MRLSIMNAKIGKIRKVELRTLWKREDANFTKWLENNIDYLTDVIGFNIRIESREKKVGPFSVDLYGEDDDGDKVIIENQLEKTDHTHLGQILTYLTNLDAKTAIWLSSDPVEEHKRAIDWLNETTPDDISFYLIQLEAIQIESESVAAPLFTVVKKPNADIKQIGAEKKKSAHRHVLHRAFWEQFIAKINKKSSICQNINPAKSSWLTVALGISGMQMFLVTTNQHARSEIYIDSGNKDKNKKIYDMLFAKKDQIESDFRGELVWRRLKNNQASKVECWLKGVNVSNKEDWGKITDFLIDRSIRMEHAFKKHIPEIRKKFQA